LYGEGEDDGKKGDERSGKGDGADEGQGRVLRAGHGLR
jgi:hypothetical protein